MTETVVRAADNGAAPPAVHAPPLLELHGITKHWTKLPKPVLEAVDLTLEPGTTTWIGGRNGIGKTTLLRIAAGLIGADTGSVSSRGLDPARDRRAFQSRVSFLSTGNTGLYARLSVRFHLGYWARLAFIPRAQRANAIERAIMRFDLEQLASRRVDRLSMGQRHRVRLAGAFLTDPEVMLLDEPRNSLDSEGVAMLAAATRALALRGGTVMWCAPTGEEAKIASDRHFILEDGKLVTA